MTTESHQIAALFAAGAERWFPWDIGHAGGNGVWANAIAEGDVITIVARDAPAPGKREPGPGKREYRAVIQLVAEDPPSGASQ